MKSLSNEKFSKHNRPKAIVMLALLVVMSLAAAPSAMAGHAVLQLVSLECLETEDHEVDEILLIASHGPTSKRFRKDMREGRIEELHMTFQVGVTIRLYDLDSGPFDHNDYLGSFYTGFPSADGRDRTHTFNRDGARYRLVYRVMER